MVFELATLYGEQRVMFAVHCQLESFRDAINSVWIWISMALGCLDQYSVLQ